MELNTGMNENERASVSGALAKVHADTYMLYIKTQNFHYNVTGPEFFSLHLLFEKHYQEMAEAVDEIAERIRALGFYVEATAEAFKKLSSIKESEKVLPKFEMLKELVEGHEIVIREERKLAALAEKHGDQATVDLMARRLGFHEKAAWMLRSQF
ncbi:MAG TPA: DNA starvation/stationary phase protection protein [Rhabdochlamydiaceae bacterium]|nr:DNA starvation/stationary phase protection protein [Rhabdochlamydiaceae bacterium]